MNVKPSPISSRGLFIWGLAALFFLYEFFLRTFVGSVAHQILPDLHLTASSFALIGSAYFVSYGLMQLPVGVIVDKFGMKTILVFATLVCALSTFLFSTATNFFSAFVSRLLMGFGSSFAFICLLNIAITWFPKRFFGFFSGASQFIGTMGPLLAGGPLVALMAASHGDWRTPLKQIALFGVVIAVTMLLVVKNKPRETGVVIHLQREKPISWRLMRLFANPQAWCVAVYSAGVYFPLSFLGAIWGTEYLQVRGLSQLSAANVISLAWLGYAVVCPLLGALSDIAKRRKPTLILCAIFGLVASTLISFVALPSLWLYELVFFILGLAAAGQNIGFAAIAEHVPLESRATALGLNNAMITTTGAVVPPLLSALITHSAAGAAFEVKDFTWAFLAMPLATILSLSLASFFVKETFCKPQKEAIKLQR